jgi:acyl-CoA thioesterase
MNREALSAIKKKAAQEPYANKLGLELLKIEEGRAIVQMLPQKDMENIFGMTHGGAIFSLIDEAFQLSCNSHGTVAVALNVSVTYHRTPDFRRPLIAESKEVHLTRKTGTYEIRVTHDNGELIASSMALAFRKSEKLPFLENTPEHDVPE